MHQSVLAFRRRRYLWLSLALSGTAILLYWIDDPQEPANGGTALGYTFGVVATLLILLLTWFGVRKRRYTSTLGTVQGWLSAHVYLGLALVVVALLHTGFQFGLNVHTLAFVLMSLVVASGLYGVTVYLKYPSRLSEVHGELNRNELLDELKEIDKRSCRTAADLPDEFREVVNSGVRRTRLGGTLVARVQGRDESQVLLPKAGEFSVVANAGQDAVLDWLAEQQSRAADTDSAARIGELSALLRTKRQLLRRIKEDLRTQALLELWLYVHVPLSAALLMSLVAHIIVVFTYW